MNPFSLTNHIWILSASFLNKFLKTPRHKSRRHSDRPRHCAVAIFRRTKSLNHNDQVNGQPSVTLHSTNLTGVMATENISQILRFGQFLRPRIFKLVESP
ncbi:hypothetical protein niasHT_034014 [Heterodera trifolii]|uniref:Uncharacterized protein n=1 Tax=Heterodera trifolii TaxID=157864 RepID=A0ABD2I9Z8_9BILA